MTTPVPELNVVELGIPTNWIDHTRKETWRDDPDNSVETDSPPTVKELAPLDDNHIDQVNTVANPELQPVLGILALLMSAGIQAIPYLPQEQQAVQKQRKNLEASRWRIRGGVLVGVALLVLFAEFFKGEPEPSRLSISILFMLLLGAVMMAMGRQDQPY